MTDKRKRAGLLAALKKAEDELAAVRADYAKLASFVERLSSSRRTVVDCCKGKPHTGVCCITNERNEETR